MTVTQIIAQVGSIISLNGQTIADADAIAWANDLLEEYALKLGNKASITVTITSADTWYAITTLSPTTTDFLRIFEVRDSTGDLYDGWELDVDQIRFTDTGTYTITYIQRPTAIAATSETPDCPAHLHRVFADYFVFRFKAKDQPQDNDTLALEARFQRRWEDRLGQLPRKRRIVQRAAWC